MLIINNLKNHHGLPVGMMAYGIKDLLTVNLLDLLIHLAVIFIISKYVTGIDLCSRGYNSNFEFLVFGGRALLMGKSK